ncbi:MAG: methyltransferase domain-containing protein, partial [Candidatus Cloacimonetes bacterium]|nr:methyltransferase domain-containing protein [Candidatus Cloacimonadota bacterium]
RKENTAMSTLTRPERLGRLLDVACGAGSFALELVQEIGDLQELVAADSSPSALEAAREVLSALPHQLHSMEAEQLEFPDGSFDTVSIANSLHHLADPEAALKEMRRVLRPGGWLVVQEMYRDTEDQAARTHVELHHWWAAVDRRRGVQHNETFLRESLISLLDNMPGMSWQLEDRVDADSDPFNPELKEHLDPVIARYQSWCDDSPGGRTLFDRGERLREQLAQHGFRSAPALRAWGRRADTR